MTLYILGLLISFAAGVWVLYRSPANRKALNLFLAGGGAFLVTILFTHVLPEVFEVIPGHAGLALLTGFLLQIVLENFSRGIEHGHAHVKSSKSSIAVAVIALCIHAFIEGMPLASAILPEPETTRNSFLVGVFLHKIPVAVTLGLLLAKAGVSRSMSITTLALFTLSTVIGTGLQIALSQSFAEIAERLMFTSLALTVGILLHVSTTILFESGDQHRLKAPKILAIAAGVALGLFL